MAAAIAADSRPNDVWPVAVAGEVGSTACTMPLMRTAPDPLRRRGQRAVAEIASLQGVSERTAQRQGEKARTLFYRALDPGR